MPLEVVARAVMGGVDAVHLRDRAASAADLLEHGEQLRFVLGGRAQLIVNDRVDVALALSADGVQLSWGSLPIARLRRLAPELPAGVSVHAAEEAAVLSGDGATWLLLGTILRTASHPGHSGAGLGIIGAVRQLTGTPIVAIGGIDATNAAACVAAGAHGVAVISAIAGAGDPRAAAAALRREIDR